MTRTLETPFADPELVELFADEPGLLAIADAIAATTPVEAPRRRLVRPSLLSAAILVAAGVAVVLVAPWNRTHGTLTDQALAAIGSEPVVHVVMESPAGAGLVDIQSGVGRPVLQRDEIWFDADHGLRKQVSRIGSTLVDDELDTPQGGFVPGGIVYDCAWIAAHPVAATNARVSCNASGNNGTKPHLIPRPKPTLDPGLAGFADSYRQALASGAAREAGQGQVDGKPVDWLVFTTSDGPEKVALDGDSHKPVLLEGTGFTSRIESIETTPYDAADFARPTADEVPMLPSVTGSDDSTEVAPTGTAIAAADPTALWAGPQVAGLPLVTASQEQLYAGFGHRAPKQTGPGFELGYGSLDSRGELDRDKPYVLIDEAHSAALSTMAGFIHGGFPPPGTLYLSPYPDAPLPDHTTGIGATALGGIYAIVNTQGMQPGTLLNVAQALTRP